MTARLKAFLQLLGGGLASRRARWVRRFNVILLVLSVVAIVILAATRFDRYAALRFHASRATLSVTVQSGWIEFGFSSTIRAAYERMVRRRGYPEGTGLVTESLGGRIDRSDAGYFRERMLSHLDWPIQFDDRHFSRIKYSLIHAVFHFWSLPVFCVVRTLMKRRRDADTPEVA